MITYKMIERAQEDLVEFWGERGKAVIVACSKVTPFNDSSELRIKMYMKLISDEEQLEQEGFNQEEIVKFFKAIKALEDGAHIVNDEVMYPPVERIKGGLFKKE